MNADQIVTAFIRALEVKDYDTAASYLAEGVVYDNVPMPTVVGREATIEGLKPFLASATAVQWVVHRQLADDHQVVNERVDRFEIGGRWLEIPVAGIFEVSDGQITLWRDYFDLGMFTSQMAG